MDFFQNASRSTEGASANAGNNRKEKIFKRSTTEIVTVPLCSVSHFSGLFKTSLVDLNSDFACAVPFMV
jgi:hypothetical protein